MTIISTFPNFPSNVEATFDFVHDEDLAAFTVTQIASGTAAVIDTNATGRNGIVLFSSVDATEDKGAQIQQDALAFEMQDNRDLMFAARFAVSEAVQSDVIVGLAVADTSLIASAPTDGIYFQSIDGSNALRLVVRQGSTLQADAPVTDLVNDQFFTVAFRVRNVNGAQGTVDAWVNGTLVTTFAISALPNTPNLASSFAFMSGAAAIQTASLDAISVAQGR